VNVKLEKKVEETDDMMQVQHALIRLEFLGANELDDKPFIVMPYLKNGKARDYANDHPGCNRLLIVMILHSVSAFDLCLTRELQLHHVSLGLVYLC
jgi:hypothetical protein